MAEAKLNISVPRAPSPFIRTCRLTALVVGVVVGAYQLKKYKKIEEDFQKQQAPMKMKLAAKQVRVNEEVNRSGMINLYREATGEEPTQAHLDRI